MVRVYVHRSEPKRANPGGPCSTLLELEPFASPADAARLAAARLGVPVAALLDESTAQPVHRLADGLHLVALEGGSPRAPLPPPAMPPPPAPPITCCPAEGCDYGGDGRRMEAAVGEAAEAEAEAAPVVRGAASLNESC